MIVDFTSVDAETHKVIDIASHYSVDDLRAATNESVNRILGYLQGLTNEDVTFDPIDSLADDPLAVEGEERIGWSLAHLIVHATASSEEGAAVASILARGIPFQGRLRYETLWNTVTTVAQCIERLEESRRMRLGALDMFPDMPFQDVCRTISEGFTAKFGMMNANATFLFGLHHEVGHYAQFEDVLSQALRAREIVG